MENSKSFEDLQVWKKAHELVLKVYKQTESFPNKETFGLTSQFRRAAVSIAANIAEGYKKKGKPDKLRFYNISQGSIEECRYYIILSRDLEYLSGEQYELLISILSDCSRLLNAYCSAIINSQDKPLTSLTTLNSLPS
jgi:four helix bundle protein